MSPAEPKKDGAYDPLASPGGFSLVEFATRRRVTVFMMTLTLVLFGLISLGSLKVNLLPDLSYPTLTVRTDYTGAAPSEIETLISQPAEEALGVVKGLRKLKSISRAPGRATWCWSSPGAPTWTRPAWTCATRWRRCNSRWRPSRRCCCASIRRPSRSCAWRCRRRRMAAAMPTTSAS
jgi:hypothetical protein